MTSSNGNIFRVIGHLCGEFTGPGESTAQRPVTRNFDVFFDLRLNKLLSKQSWSWWFETPSRPLWRHRYEMSFGGLSYIVTTPSLKWWTQKITYYMCFKNLKYHIVFIHILWNVTNLVYIASRLNTPLVPSIKLPAGHDVNTGWIDPGRL